MYDRLALLINACPELAAIASRAWDGRLLSLAHPVGLDRLPDAIALVVVERDHPDQFRRLCPMLRRRWPLAEIIVVDGPWNASAGHTRKLIPPAMRRTREDAIERIERIAAGDPPMAWPWTLSRTDAALAHAEAIGS